tara:strand:- start:431 stop:910 length:480 start_codon:yes stop_codon:yes gene_type:complete
MIKANDKTRKSWIHYENDSDFPIQNIPFGVFTTKIKDIHIGTIIGDTVISLSNLEKLGYFETINLEKNTFQGDTLNKFLKQRKNIWREVRDRIAILFDEKNTELQNNDQDKQHILFNVKNTQNLMPVKIGNYTDFYSSKDHAMNVGKMFRDPDNALLPN